MAKPVLLPFPRKKEDMDFQPLMLQWQVPDGQCEGHQTFPVQLFPLHKDGNVSSESMHISLGQIKIVKNDYICSQKTIKLSDIPVV